MLSELVPHRKHHNLSLLLQDFQFNQIGGAATEKIALNREDTAQPQKRKLKLFQNILDKGVEEAASSEPEDPLARLMQARKYDVKVIKEEIWKVLEGVIPQIDHRTQRRLQAEDSSLTFSEMVASLPAVIANQEMVQSMSIHTVFVCLLHLANEHKLLMKQVMAVDDDPLEDFNIFIELC